MKNVTAYTDHMKERVTDMEVRIWKRELRVKKVKKAYMNGLIIILIFVFLMDNQDFRRRDGEGGREFI